MKIIDRVLQRWRNAKARPYVAPGARVLDIGCADGALFRQFHSLIGEGVGIDPTLDYAVDGENYRLIPGRFPDDVTDERRFDVITMLAVLEHVPAAYQPRWAEACARLLADGGHLVITVPSPSADGILRALQSLRLIDGMSLEQHYGFDPRTAPAIFGVDGLALVKFERFQLGFNNLLVFERTARRAGCDTGSRLERAHREGARADMAGAASATTREER